MQKQGKKSSDLFKTLGYDGIINGDEYIVFDSNQIKSVYNLNPTEDEDILKEPRTEYDNQLKLNMDVTTNVVESAKKYNGGLKPIVRTNKVWEGFKKQGYVDLKGTKVSTVQDMAEVAQIFRNPYYETFRVAYTKNGVIVGAEGLTSYLPNAVNMLKTKGNTIAKIAYKINDRMKRLDADAYYLIHNHPSGKAEASKPDIGLTQDLTNKVQEYSNKLKGEFKQRFLGHIIIDHGTYALITIKAGGANPRVENNIKLDKSTYDIGSLTNGFDRITISSRNDIAQLGNSLRHDSNYSSLILTDSSNSVNAIIDLPNSMLNNKELSGYIKNIAKQAFDNGSGSAFTVTV